MMKFEAEVDQFLELANVHGLKMLMVGGGAVNYHGYKRHSADVDFWIDMAPENLEILRIVLIELGYACKEFPQAVKDREQNISIKISPSQEIELITRFDPGKSFDEAYKDAVIAGPKDSIKKYHVLSYQDLVASKIRSNRPKDLLDIQELKRIKGDGPH